MPVPRKSGMTPRPVYRDPHDLGAVLVKLGENLVVQRDLVATHRAPVGRVEYEDDWSSSELAQTKYLVGRRVKGEVWSWCAGGENVGDVCGRC